MEMTPIIDTGFIDWTHLIVILSHDQRVCVAQMTFIIYSKLFFLLLPQNVKKQKNDLL